MRTLRWLRRGGLFGLIALLTAALTMFGAEPAVAQETTYSVQGVVTFDGAPQAGVTVCATSPAICDITDKAGRYSLSGLDQFLRIYAEAADGASPWVTTWFGDSTDGTQASVWDLADSHMPDSADIQLQIAPTVTGTVISTSGKAVKKAQVCVAESTNCVTTSSRGEYRLFAQIPHHDPLALVAKAAGYRSAKTTTSVPENVKITLVKKRAPKIRSAKPKLVGKKKVGKKLRVKRGRWRTPSVHYTYRWYRNGHRIRGAQGRTYRLTWADWRKNIKVKVVATKPGYRKTVRASKGTGWIRWSEWHRR